MPYGLKDKEMKDIYQIFASNSDINKVVLYGSRAMGTHRNGSDVDLSVSGDGLDIKFLTEVYDKIDSLFLPYKFDISIYEDISNEDLKEHIKKVGIELYTRS